MDHLTQGEVQSVYWLQGTPTCPPDTCDQVSPTALELPASLLPPNTDHASAQGLCSSCSSPWHDLNNFFSYSRPLLKCHLSVGPSMTTLFKILTHPFCHPGSHLSYFVFISIIQQLFSSNIKFHLLIYQVFCLLPLTVHTLQGPGISVFFLHLYSPSTQNHMWFGVFRINKISNSTKPVKHKVISKYN